MTALSTVQVLNEAAEYVAAGWCRGAYARRSDGLMTDAHKEDAIEVCAVGAISRAIGFTDPDNWTLEEDETFLRARFALVDAAGIAVTAPLGPWNDAPERTQAEVVETLRRAAVLAAS